MDRDRMSEGDRTSEGDRGTGTGDRDRENLNSLFDQTFCLFKIKGWTKWSQESF